MNVDRILDTMNRHQVAYLLIGGMNFLLRHAPVLTVDVDLWIEDSAENRTRCEAALAELEAEWGPSDDEWRLVGNHRPGWLGSQGVYCLMSPAGAIDIFRAVKGLDCWASCFACAARERLPSGIPYAALSDADMLRCQMALSEGERKHDRIRILTEALKTRPEEDGDERIA